MSPDTDDPESTATDAEVKSEPKPAAETKAGQKQPQTEAGTATDLDAIEPETIIIDAAPPPSVQEYDPTEDREKVRANIALILVYALVGVVAFALFSAWIVMPAENRAALFEVLKIVFAPLVGLVGAATGFYYGGKSK